MKQFLKRKFWAVTTTRLVTVGLVVLTAATTVAVRFPQLRYWALTFVILWPLVTIVAIALGLTKELPMGTTGFTGPWHIRPWKPKSHSRGYV